MGTINSDIELFNHHVKNAKEGLNSRGEVVNDLILKLFQGYKAAADTNFVAYIQKKEEDYMDEQGKDIEPEALMQLALNKFAQRKENGEWDAPYIEQEQITALTAELSNFKSNAKSDKKDKQKGKNKEKDKTNKRKDKKKKKSWEWKKIPRPPDSPHTKIVDGQTNRWCVNHQAWTNHEPSKCRLPTSKAKIPTTEKGKTTGSKLDEAL